MKKTVGSIILCVGIALRLGAQDFSSLGWQLRSQTKEGPNTVYRFTAPGEVDVTLSFRGERLSKVDQERTQGVISAIKDFRLLLPASVRVILAEERAEVLVIPRSFRYKDRDLVPFMPSGVQFFYTDFLEFDFRIVVQNLFVRIKGQFFKEEEFAEKLLSAITNPYGYIQSQDPEHILKRFQQVEDRIDRLVQELAKESDKVRSALESAVQDLRASLESLKQEVERDMKAQKEKQQELEQKQKEKQQDLEQKLSALTNEFQLLRYALLVLNNRGFFGSIRLPSETGIQRLVELKKQQPNLTKEEAQARLKAEGIEMSSKEVFLVFSVYFNEFK